MSNIEIPQKTPPPKIAKTLNEWRSLWVCSAAYHYTFGVLGVTCSAVAATDIECLRRPASVIAVVCFAVIGYVNPQRRYLKFVRAWRVLDAAVDRYQYLNGSMRALLAAKARGERIIADLEQETDRPQKATGVEKDPPTKK